MEYGRLKAYISDYVEMGKVFLGRTYCDIVISYSIDYKDNVDFYYIRHGRLLVP